MDIGKRIIFKPSRLTKVLEMTKKKEKVAGAAAGAAATPKGGNNAV
jgi:hypothetical protein